MATHAMPVAIPRDEHDGVTNPSSKYVSYAAFGYPALDLSSLVDPMHDRELLDEICNDAIDNGFGGAIDGADSNCYGIKSCGEEGKF